MKQSFICPCFNEEKNVKLFAKTILDSFPNTDDYELVFINDGSGDNTFSTLKELKKESTQNIKIINFSRNFGKEAAMYAGLQNCKGDYITIIDTDLQQSPEIVKNMISILDSESDIDCVCACQENRSESAFSKFCKKSFYKFADKYTDTHFVDGASDFRTFRKNVKDAILSMGEYYRFSKGIFSWVGFNTKYIPYTADERLNGKSSFNFTKLLKYGLNGIVAFSTVPLKISGYVGGITVVLSLIYAIITVIRKLVSNINVDGFTQLVILIAFLGGIQLFTIGIMGEYLAKNYIETKRRPIYIAKQIIDYDNEDEK
ncbi:MAG: glycosyltransferase family 2 protein [Eubacteriales bacterium]|nr:glycosyltransferase family 2 protein [Eubacteriales bacterium]